MGSELSSSLIRRRIASFTALFSVTVSLLIIGIYADHGMMKFMPVASLNTSLTTTKNKLTSITHRKLLSNDHGKRNENGKMKKMEPNRIWSEKCSKSDIAISQDATAPLPNGIPSYAVEITNVCLSGCEISAVHLRCGWFSSARLVNRRIFRRLRFNDCLVNDGKPLANGRTLSFQYSNTFRYPLSVASVTC